MHTHIYIHFHTSHISHIRVNTRHELLTADFASPHTADGPAHTSRPAADHLHLRYGLCARQHNQSQPSLRTHALSGTPDGAFCPRVQHPPPAHSSPAPCTCPPKPPAPVSPPNDRTPGRAPASGSRSHSRRGTKTACAETVSRRSCSGTPHTAPKHINGTEAAHHSAQRLRPSPVPPQTLSGEVPGGAQSTSCARQVAATCTERFGPMPVAKLDIICAHAAAGFGAKSPPLLYTTCSPPLGASRPRRPVGPMRTALHGGTRTEGAHSGGDPPRTLQPLPPHPDRPMQRAPHLLRQAPGAPGPTRPPMQGTQPPIPLSWAATRAGGGQDR